MKRFIAGSFVEIKIVKGRYGSLAYVGFFGFCSFSLSHKIKALLLSVYMGDGRGIV
jgi:hypothetical protein